MTSILALSGLSQMTAPYFHRDLRGLRPQECLVSVSSGRCIGLALTSRDRLRFDAFCRCGLCRHHLEPFERTVGTSEPDLKWSVAASNAFKRSTYQPLGRSCAWSLCPCSKEEGCHLSQALPQGMGQNFQMTNSATKPRETDSF